MSRITRRRTIRAVAPVAGLLAAGLLVWQGSYAAFSATTTNKSDAWATGNLVLTNNGGAGTTYAVASTTALFSLSNLKSSDSGARCITVDSSGSLAGTLKFFSGAISDVNGTSGPNLSGKLNLVVTAATLASSESVDATCIAGGGTVAFPTSSAAPVYTGNLAGLGTSYASATSTGVNVAGGSGQRVAYKIAWSFDPSINNAYQSASTTADLVWEIQ